MLLQIQVTIEKLRMMSHVRELSIHAKYLGPGNKFYSPLTLSDLSPAINFVLTHIPTIS